MNKHKLQSSPKKCLINTHLSIRAEDLEFRVVLRLGLGMWMGVCGLGSRILFTVLGKDSREGQQETYLMRTYTRQQIRDKTQQKK